MQAVLDLVSELCHYCIRNVSRALRNEENGYALGSYELDDLLDLLEEALARVLEEKMRFVKKEYHLRLFRIAYLRQHLEELRQQVQHECRVESRLVYKRLGIEDVDDAASVRCRQEKVADVDRRLAEEPVRTL